MDSNSYEKENYGSKIIGRDERDSYWKTAIGLNKVDGLVPSGYLLKLKEESVSGRKSYDAVENELHDYYRKIDDSDSARTKECDIVSTRIARILESDSFVFSPVTLKNIHKQLFTGIFSGALAGHAGKFREYNITKAEAVLNGESVVYADYATLDEYLKYDFDKEATKNYSELTKKTVAKELAKFTSSIWQIHPFVEGNTRTTAVFLEKYMRSLGFDVDNTLFHDHSVYFRNALVLSNYQNMPKKIRPGFGYLEVFLANLLEGNKIPLPKIVAVRDREDDFGL